MTTKPERTPDYVWLQRGSRLNCNYAFWFYELIGWDNTIDKGFNLVIVNEVVYTTASMTLNKLGMGIQNAYKKYLKELELIDIILTDKD